MSKKKAMPRQAIHARYVCQNTAWNFNRID